MRCFFLVNMELPMINDSSAELVMWSSSFCFRCWFITDDPWIDILISNEIRFSFSFRLIENDAISIHRFESFHKLNFINWCACFCDVISFKFLSGMIHCINDFDFVFHILSMCYSLLIFTLCRLQWCKHDWEAIQTKVIK